MVTGGGLNTGGLIKQINILRIIEVTVKNIERDSVGLELEIPVRAHTHTYTALEQ